MLSLTSLLQAQGRYGISTDTSGDQVPYSAYLEDCRQYLANKTGAEYYRWDKTRQKNHNSGLITEYVKTHVKNVSGFADSTGELKQDELVDTLTADISDYGLLRQAFDDDLVQEIQINDYKTIWVVKKGITEQYIDPSGHPYMFSSNDELEKVINRLIYNPLISSSKMTLTSPLLNARTTQSSYRLSAVHSTATTPDLARGFDFPVTTCTIRKHATSRLSLDLLTAGGTMTPKMSSFLKLCAQADLSIACVGKTSSGKTTLLNALMNHVPNNQRIILIQNPTEIRLYERDSVTGTNARNVLHWEAQDNVRDVNDPSAPTMANFVDHALRNTPDILCLGESRSGMEFLRMYNAAQTGQRVMTTFHADGAGGASRRAGEAIASVSKGTSKDYAVGFSDSFDIILSCKRFGDGTRRLYAIEEYTGEVDAKGFPLARRLAGFTLDGNNVRDASGAIKSVGGSFSFTGAISEKLKEKFYSAGISKDELIPYLPGGDTDVD